MKTIAFVFGRFNPPTIGHGKLLDALKATAQRMRADRYIFMSNTEDAKKNPLTKQVKTKYMKKMFPSDKKYIKQKYKGVIRHVFDIANNFNDEYDKLVMVAGSDRVSEFHSILNTYNGMKGKHGFYEYDEIEVVSAGERDPDADGASGMSASKMRAAAVKGDFETFKAGVPSTMGDSDTRNMMNSVRKGMKLDVIIERMKVRRGLQEPLAVENIDPIDAKELTWQGYDTTNLSTCDEAYELFDEIINSITESSYTKAELGYLKESLMLVDRCLTITQVPDELIEKHHEQEYLICATKAIKLLEGVGKRIGVPFNYSFLNDLQVKIINEMEKPQKSFSSFIGDMYGGR